MGYFITTPGSQIRILNSRILNLGKPVIVRTGFNIFIGR